MKKLGVMIDMSRNAVMSIDGLKRFFALLAKMGYNCAMLYTEDTYEVDGEPYFGYFRGRYGKDEIREIDAYADSLGIELIPCIQTLAHLNATIRWGQFPVDTGDILLTDDPRSYEFIEHMFKTVSECFKTKYIHIGMDEAHMLGRGKHLDLHGYESSSDCIKRHLERVREIGEKFGFKMMMWSDMFFRAINHGGYYMKKAELPQSTKDSLAEGIIPVYWDYYSINEQSYDDMLYNHKQLSDEVWFAGGIWSWMGLVPLNRRSLDTMLPALRACKTHGIENIFFTMWGDNGGECSHFSQLPALYYLAECAKGNTDENAIKSGFKSLIGIDFDDFMAIDLPNLIDEDCARFANPSKYMLYSDYFNGFLDTTVNSEGAAKYADIAVRLAKIGESAGEYAYVFESIAKLCRVLELKYDIGVRLRRAYTENDRETLAKIASYDLVEIEQRLREFHAAFERQWFRDNKTSGFDVQDLRLGGLIQRTISCRRRLDAYLAGEISRIEELEQKLLLYPNSREGHAIELNLAYVRASSANSI